MSGKAFAAIGAAATVAIATVVHVGGASAEPANGAVLFLGRFHPVVVHLPIGALLLAAFMEAASIVPWVRGRLDGAVTFVLLSLTASSLVGFVLGHLLAREGGYPTRLLELHRTFALSAVIGAASCLVAWTSRAGATDRRGRALYRLALGATVATLTVGAHFGGSMTRGDGWLVRFAPPFIQRLLGEEPVRPTDAPGPAPGDEPLVFRDAVLPVLKARCVECHGEEQSKGGLRVDSIAALLAGGDGGPAVVPRAGELSPLVERMLLPPADDDHMPPEGREGPSTAEVDLIRWWIDRGGAPEMRVGDTLPPDGGSEVLSRVADTARATANAAGTAVKATGSPPPGSSASPPHRTPATATSSAPASLAASATSFGPGPAAATQRDGLVYRDLVAPVLASRCASCHGAAKQKGKLRVDSIAAMERGGASGPALVPGAAHRSLLVARARFPSSDDLHMPPSGSPQPEPNEVELVAWWIDAGAREDVQAATVPAALRSARAASPPIARAAEVAHGDAQPTSDLDAAATAPTGPDARPVLLLDRGDVDLHGVARAVLDRRCVSCHSDGGPAAKLSVETHASILRGGKSGPVVTPSVPAESALIRRMTLPLSDRKHMPPSDEPQPIAAELEALRIWIEAGATESPIVRRDSHDAATLATLRAALDPPRGAPPTVAEAAPRAPKAPPAAAAAGPRSGGCVSCDVADRGSPDRAALWGALVLVALVTRRRGTHAARRRARWSAARRPWPDTRRCVSTSSRADELHRPAIESAAGMVATLSSNVVRRCGA